MRIALCAALALSIAGSGLAIAAPRDVRPAVTAPIILAANGCGPRFFRTIDGACVPNGRAFGPRGRAVVLPPPCPRGFLRDPNPARPLCYPVF